MKHITGKIKFTQIYDVEADVEDDASLHEAEDALQDAFGDPKNHWQPSDGWTHSIYQIKKCNDEFCDKTTPYQD